MTALDRDVVPGWVKRPADGLAAARFWVRLGLTVAAFHAVRSPKYAAHLSLRSPIGLWRTVAATAVWCWDAESAVVRGSVAGKGAEQAKDFVKAHEVRKETIRTRLLLVAGGCAVVVLAAAWVTSRGIPLALVLFSLVLALGWVGSRDVTIADSFAESAPEPPITHGLIVNALATLGINELNKALKDEGDTAIRFNGPATRGAGGWEASLDLPPGVPASAVIAVRERLASGLRRPESCVWPESDSEQHASRLNLWVADEPPARRKLPEWPTLTAAQTNVFEPMVIGWDHRGREVLLPVACKHAVVGSATDMGKSRLLKLVAEYFALDPRTELYIYDFKGGRGWVEFEGIAKRIVRGSSPESLNTAADDLRNMVRDMQRRNDTLGSLPLDRCPDDKVTDDLASDKSLALHPVLVILDECQLAWNWERGEEMKENAEKMARLSRSAGYSCWFATQDPHDKSLPRIITDQCATKTALRVKGWRVNDVILGESMYQEGVRATRFSDRDKGMAIMVGPRPDPVTVKFPDVDDLAARPILDRARGLRAAAAGPDTAEVPAISMRKASLVDHLLEVWPEGRDRAQFVELLPLLQATDADRYGDWDTVKLGQACKSHGLESTQVKSRGVNLRGIKRPEVEA